MSYGLDINKGTHAKLQGFRELIEGFIVDQADKNAYEIGTNIIRQSGIINDVCQDTSPENLSRKENIEELVNGMNDFCALRQEEGNPNVSLTDFLSEIALLTDQDSDKADDGEKITLMTVHSAKGLEFKNVFVVGLEENLFPSGMVGDSPRALEEERRLFYVAITRAEEHCYLSFAKTRFRYGKMEFGIGHHGEPGINVQDLKPAKDIARQMAKTVIDDMEPEEGSEVAVLMSGLGATPVMELYVLYDEVEEYLKEQGLSVYKVFIGDYVTSLDMNGAALTVLKLDDELKELLDYEAKSPGIEV